MEIERGIIKANESIERPPADKLYLLVSEDGSMFKIGISSNLDSRVNQLQREWGELDLNSSYVIDGDDVRMRSLEKMLHFLYSEHNIQHDSGRDGRTEWFDITCFDQVISEVQRVSELKEDSGININKGITPPRKPLASSENFESTEARLERQSMEMVDSNNDQADAFTSAFDDIATHVTNVELIEKHGDTAAVIHFSALPKTAEDQLDFLIRSGTLRSTKGSSNIVACIKSWVEGDSVSGQIELEYGWLRKYSEYPESAQAATLIIESINRSRNDT